MLSDVSKTQNKQKILKVQVWGRKKVTAEKVQLWQINGQTLGMCLSAF